MAPAATVADERSRKSLSGILENIIGKTLPALKPSLNSLLHQLTSLLGSEPPACCRPVKNGVTDCRSK
jgi:hypothetical protein